MLPQGLSKRAFEIFDFLRTKVGPLCSPAPCRACTPKQGKMQALALLQGMRAPPHPGPLLPPLGAGGTTQGLCGKAPPPNSLKKQTPWGPCAQGGPEHQRLLDVYTFTTAIAVCSTTQQLQRAFELVADMRTRSIACNVRVAGGGARGGGAACKSMLRASSPNRMLRCRRHALALRPPPSPPAPSATHPNVPARRSTPTARS